MDYCDLTGKKARKMSEVSKGTGIGGASRNIFYFYFLRDVFVN